MAHPRPDIRINQAGLAQLGVGNIENGTQYYVNERIGDNDHWFWVTVLGREERVLNNGDMINLIKCRVHNLWLLGDMDADDNWRIPAEDDLDVSFNDNDLPVKYFPVDSVNIRYFFWHPVAGGRRRATHRRRTTSRRTTRRRIHRRR